MSASIKYLRLRQKIRFNTETRRTQPSARRAYAPEGDEIIFSFAGISARPYKSFKGGGPTAMNETHQPFRAKVIRSSKQQATFCPSHCLAGQSSFCPSSPPLRGRFQPVGLTGRRVGSPSRRPMGKKRKTLCALCGSVVKYSIKNRSLYL